MRTTEAAWLTERCVSGPIAKSKEVLRACIDRLTSEEVKMPLNVPRSDVLRGVLTRSGDRVIVTGHAHFHHHNFDVQNVAVTLPQVSLLRAALEQVMVELSTLTTHSSIHEVLEQTRLAQEGLVLARRQLTTPERSFRFPEKFFGLGKTVPTGYCGEMFACEEHNLVFNLHAYQDRGQTYVATDSVSVKGADPQLSELWQALDADVIPGLQHIVDQLQAVLIACM